MSNVSNRLLEEAPNLFANAIARGWIRPGENTGPAEFGPARHRTRAEQLAYQRVLMRRLRAERQSEDCSHFPPRVRKSRGGDDWFETWTGRQFWPLRPTQAEVDIEDVAHSLSLTNRFNGHTRFPYSVGQHSLMVCQIVRAAKPDAGPVLWLQALLHDAPEAYLGDMVKPLKRGMPAYRTAEARLWRVIARKYGVPREMDPIVKFADMVALATERRDLRRPTLHRWTQIRDGITPVGERIVYRPFDEVEAEFLRTFEELNR